MNKFFISIVITLLLSICISGVYAESTVILYTNDVYTADTKIISPIVLLPHYRISINPSLPMFCSLTTGMPSRET